VVAALQARLGALEDHGDRLTSAVKELGDGMGKILEQLQKAQPAAPADGGPPLGLGPLLVQLLQGATAPRPVSSEDAMQSTLALTLKMLDMLNTIEVNGVNKAVNLVNAFSRGVKSGFLAPPTEPVAEVAAPVRAHLAE
jgi:hypothetical protein